VPGPTRRREAQPVQAKPFPLGKIFLSNPILSVGAIRGDLGGSLFPSARSCSIRSQEECGLLRIRYRDTQDFACTGLNVGVWVDRDLRFPQLHHPYREHDGRDMGFFPPPQHFQKGDGLGKKLKSIFALAQFQQ